MMFSIVKMSCMIVIILISIIPVNDTAPRKTVDKSIVVDFIRAIDSKTT